MIRALALAVAALAAIGAAADAQGRAGAGQRPPVDTLRRAPGDTTRKDTLALAPADSIMRAMLARPGFQATRFEGDSVTYDATNERLHLYGKPAFVVRDKTRITGDSVRYEDALKVFVVGGAPAVVHDPARGEDIVAYSPIRYDIENQTGSACDVRTSANSGSIWHIVAACSGFVADTGGGVVYARDALLSTDPRVYGDTADWAFRIREMKRKGSSLIVGSSTTLKIGEVPVFWIPWFLQDMRKGRRSGILTPRFGIAELVRNSPSYRRTVENVGFYIALNDYFDTQLSLDWRSSARPTDIDPGWLTVHGNLRYKWLDRFIDGNIGVSHTSQSNGQSNLVLSWNHSQSFSRATSLRSTLQYAANTAVQRNTTINPFAVAASILSTANYQTEFGSLRTSIGGSQRQYLGRDQIDRDFPTVNIASKPLELAPWLTWTPTFSSSTSESLHMDGPSEFGFRYTPLPGGGVDSTRLDRSERTTRVSFGTPLKAGNFTISASARMTDHERNEPAAKIVIDAADTSIKRTIVFDRTYLTSIDWDLGVNLPQFFQGTWNLTPSVVLRNVDPAGYIVRSERTGSKWVSQSKRAAYGLSITPTFYQLFPGIGVFDRIRHSVTPAVSYSYSPEATVSDDFLAALGRTRAGYLGTLAQERVSLSLSTVIEAKRRPREGDTTTDPQAQQSIRLLSINVTPLEYDFERARVTGRSGFATERIGATLRSDLLPGFDFGADYSLFDAPSISDTANFKPHLESINASLSLTRNAGLLAPIRKFFSWLTGESPDERVASDSGTAPQGAAAAVAGSDPNTLVGGRSRPALVDVPTGQGFQASLTFTAQRPRPPRGANVIAVDPTIRCQPYRDTSPLQYDICVRQQTTLSNGDPDLSTGGGVAFRYPNQTSIGSRMSFNLSENWAMQWQTNYDVERAAFATQIVTLQREMGDWRATFGFLQAPNGNFAFNFMITLKPAPDLKLGLPTPELPRAGSDGPTRVTVSIKLDGASLTIADVVAVARDGAQAALGADARAAMMETRAVVESILRRGEPVYGVNTGFGKLSEITIPPDQLEALQRNLVRSHAAGVGAPLADEIVRAMMLLRANVLAKGHSGARPQITDALLAMLAHDIIPVIPEHGSVGASGDLAPLAHLALALIGEGRVRFRGRDSDAASALKAAGVEPVTLGAKEGIALINGTQAHTAIGALAMHDARMLWETANVAGAMSLEALLGTPAPFDERIQDVRGQAGQSVAAQRLRALLADSEIRESHRHGDPRVQDAYALRCMPQVHGPALDGLLFATNIVARELNAATDNPLVFRDGAMLSGGNFHGQAVALACDVLAIALTNLAVMSERRIDRLVNPDLNQGLPPFLAARPGLDSGLMMVQVTAAALASECKLLAHPASVDSIPTDGNREDVVPMAMGAARKLRTIVDHLTHVLAIELLCAAAGVDHRAPLKPGRGVLTAHARVRALVAPQVADRAPGTDITALAHAIRAGAFATSDVS